MSFEYYLAIWKKERDWWATFNDLIFFATLGYFSFPLVRQIIEFFHQVYFACFVSALLLTKGKTFSFRYYWSFKLIFGLKVKSLPSHQWLSGDFDKTTMVSLPSFNKLAFWISNTKILWTVEGPKVGVFKN